MNSHEAKQHLLWLLASLGLVLVLHATQLVPWVPLLALALGAWRFAITLRHRSLPGMLLLVPITVVSALGILVSYGGLFGRDAGVALLVVMTALKTLETRNRRDMTLTIYLGYFLSICAFLFSQSIPVAIFMALPVIALTATLIGLSHPNGALAAMAKLRLSGIMLAQALPVMLVLFVLFPRVSGPLWGIPEDMARGQVGLSEDMSPGSISELSQSGAPAFRAEFQGSPPPASSLYWRGPVLWQYDGRTWRQGSTPQILPQAGFEPLSPPVNYSVTLEANNKPWLFMLDLPVKRPPASLLTRDYQTIARQPVRQRIRYEAASALTYRDVSPLANYDRQRALQLPPMGNMRARELAAQWREETQDPRALMQRALAMYNASFTYTLRPPLLGSSAVDGFLFDTRKGFCEHYAGSFVFLMRAAGVPARVVTGYQGGELNTMGDYLLIRQSDAHAWAEIWLEGQGWVRVDPTAAVAPERVERGIAAAMPDFEPLPGLARPELTWLKRINLGWDAANNGWNQWVLGYNQQRQMEFLARLAGSKVDWGDMALWMTGLLTFIVGAIAAFMLRDTLPQNDPALAAWIRFQRKIARAGVSIFPNEGPRDFTRRASRMLFRHSAEIEQIGRLYTQLRYGEGGGLAELQARVRKFRA